MRWRRTMEAMRSSSAPVRWGSYCCIEDGSQVASPRGRSTTDRNAPGNRCRPAGDDSLGEAAA